MTEEMGLRELRELFGRVIHYVNPIEKGKRKYEINTSTKLEQLMKRSVRTGRARSRRGNINTLVEHGFPSRVIDEANRDMVDRRRRPIFAVGLGWIRRRRRRRRRR